MLLAINGRLLLSYDVAMFSDVMIKPTFQPARMSMSSIAYHLDVVWALRVLQSLQASL